MARVTFETDLHTMAALVAFDHHITLADTINAGVAHTPALGLVNGFTRTAEAAVACLFLWRCLTLPICTAPWVP